MRHNDKYCELPIMNKPNRISKIQMLHMELTKAIRDGELRPGDKLPTESQLCSTYSVSRITVRSALSLLVNEGLLFSQQGKGTFVLDHTEAPLTIGVVLHQIAHEGSQLFKYYSRFTVRILNHIEEETRKNGANVLLYVDNGNVETERENLLNIANRRLDGAIVFYIGEEENLDCLQKIQDAGIPLVLIDRWIDGFESDCVATNNFKGAYEATSLLINRNVSPIIHLTDSEGVSSIFDRSEGYKMAMRSHYRSDVEIKSVTHDYAQSLEESAYELIKGMLGNVGDSFGLFAANASAMVGAWRAISESGMDTKRLALACFDELPIELPSDVYFANVIQPIEQLGEVAVRAIMNRIAGSKDNQRFILEPRVEVLSSEAISINGD